MPPAEAAAGGRSGTYWSCGYVLALPLLLLGGLLAWMG
jgi:hypothetical protein